MSRRGTHHRSGSEEAVIVIGKGDDLHLLKNTAKTINDELMNVGVELSEEVQGIFDMVGKGAVEKLRQTSPKNEKSKQKGRYAKGWTYERGKTTWQARNTKVGGTVRNKTDPQLTHLLEYGHPIVRKGKVVGYSDPIEHINPVAEWAADAIDNYLSKL